MALVAVPAAVGPLLGGGFAWPCLVETDLTVVDRDVALTVAGARVCWRTGQRVGSETFLESLHHLGRGHEIAQRRQLFDAVDAEPL